MKRKRKWTVREEANAITVWAFRKPLHTMYVAREYWIAAKLINKIVSLGPTIQHSAREFPAFSCRSDLTE